MKADRAALTIDVELFSHTPAYRNASGSLRDPSIGIDGVEFLLDRLDRHDVHATCFVVSELVEGYRSVVEKIVNSGHEIGSHTHSHRRLSSLSRRERRCELSQSRKHLEALSGTDVLGCRAPAFDAPPGYLADVSRTGYRYDSSMIPAREIFGWYADGYDLRKVSAITPSDSEDTSDVMEIPVSVMPGLRFPISGAWLRLFGWYYTRTGMELLARRGAVPILYIHPWELVDLPPIDGIPRRVYWRTGKWMRRAVDRLLDTDFEFVRLDTLLNGEVKTSL